MRYATLMAVAGAGVSLIVATVCTRRADNVVTLGRDGFSVAVTAKAGVKFKSSLSTSRFNSAYIVVMFSFINSCSICHL